MKRWTLVLLATAQLAMAAHLAAADAGPTSVVRPAPRSWELEAHFTFAWDPSVYGTMGLGAGTRLGIVLGRTMTLPRLADEISLELGADWVHYDCPYAPAPGPIGPTSTFRCPDAHALWFPAALQWSFFGPRVDAEHPLENARRWSLFLEAGAAVYASLYGTCPVGAKCDLYAHGGARPLVALGVRWLPARHFAVTVHVGYPMLTAGVSIW